MTTSMETSSKEGWDAVGSPGLLRTLRRAWKSVALASLIGGILGAAVSALQTPQYEARSLLILSGPGEATIFRSASSRDTERHLFDEVERMRSDDVVSRAAVLLGAGWTPGSVRASITARPDLQRNAIELTGRAPTDTDAVTLTNTVTDAFEQVAAEREVATAQRAIDRLSGYFEELQATVDEARDNLDALRAEAETDLAALPTEERIRLANARLAADPRTQALQRQRDDALSELSSLRNEARKIRIDATLRGSGVDRVDSAATPARKVRPQPIRDGALVAVLAITLIALTRWAQAEHRPKHLDGREAARFLGAPVLAELKTSDIWAPTEPENRRQLADASSTLQFALEGEDGHTVLVTSIATDEDRTATALNLALAAARQAQRAILVDGDLIRGVITELLSLKADVGWSDAGPDGGVPGPYLARSSDGTVIGAIPTGRRRTRPLDSEALATSLAAVRAPGVTVIVDAPPILPLIDASSMARHVDGVVVVVADWNVTSDLERARWRLQALAAPVVGCVVLRPRRRWVRRWLRRHTGRASQTLAPLHEPGAKGAPHPVPNAAVRPVRGRATEGVS